MSDKDISLPNDLTVIGYPDKIKELLKNKNYCFGQLHDANHPECQKCRTPVVVDGQVIPLKTLCKKLCRGENFAQVRQLGSEDVQLKLDQGHTVQEIFDFMVGSSPTESQGREARKILYRRLYYLSKKLNYPTPDLPSLENLMP